MIKPLKSDRGFTIMEILVVVAVISVIASTILLNTNLKRPGAELKEHASRIGKTLKLLMQEAILEDRNYALSLVPDSFIILEYNGQEWLPSEDRFILGLQKEHQYEDEVTIDNAIIAIEKTEKPVPHILILSSGEMSVFQWAIADRENNLRALVTSNMLGGITIEGPAESL
jgi:general secretion pathway protein H